MDGSTSTIPLEAGIVAQGLAKAAELLDYSIEAFRNFRLMDETRHAATR